MIFPFVSLRTGNDITEPDMAHVFLQLKCFQMCMSVAILSCRKQYHGTRHTFTFNLIPQTDFITILMSNYIVYCSVNDLNLEGYFFLKAIFNLTTHILVSIKQFTKHNLKETQKRLQNAINPFSISTVTYGTASRLSGP